MQIDGIKTASEAPNNPFALFQSWFNEIHDIEKVFPDHMTLATVDAQGRPDARVMLLKGFDEDGFVFYTNTLSKKGADLKANPYACLNFYWKPLERQVRIHGPVAPVSAAEADAYYATRPRGSRIGAWASQQSQPLESRDDLFNRVNSYEEQFADQNTIPRPPHWSGYRVTPERMEFWHLGEFRLHTRVVYTPDGQGGWDKEMLNP